MLAARRGIETCPCSKAGARKWGAFVYFPHGNSGVILFSKYGTENPSEEKTSFSLSTGRSVCCCQCAAGTEVESAAIPFGESDFPFRYKNRCKNPARPVLLAAHRTSLQAE